MKKTEMNLKAYMAPDCAAYELRPEGVLCQSGLTADPEDLGEGENGWFE